MNYAKDLPQDKKDQRFDGSPPSYPSLQSVSGNPAVSSVISLSANTTVIEFNVFGGQSANSAIIFKWGSSSVTSSNFDGVVISGETRAFVVPVSVAGVYPSIQGVNAANGLYKTVSINNVNTTVASVLTVEY